MSDTSPVIELAHVRSTYGEMVVHADVNLTIQRGEIIGLVGGSGSGKTTLLREILMLRPYEGGTIKVLGHDLQKSPTKTLASLRNRFGVLFQQGALLSSLTVLENIMFPMQEHTKLSKDVIRKIAQMKISMVGLANTTANLYPAELSGGMLKRAALARAIAMDPEILFLDEPTAGLDPDSADGLDCLVCQLRESLGLTILIVTHDLDTLWRTTDRVVFLGEKKIIAAKPIAELVEHPHPLIQAYFAGPRGRKATKEALSGHES